MQRLIPKILYVFVGTLALLWTATLPASAKGLLQDVPGTPVAKLFELPDTDGKIHKLADHKGKIVILNFWATWCPPCRKEMPSMQRAWDQLKKRKDIIMIAVHVGGNEDKIWNFMGDGDYDFLVLIDKSRLVPKQWPMRGLPSTFIINPAGKIVLRAIGERKWDDPSILKQILAVK